MRKSNVATLLIVAVLALNVLSVPAPAQASSWKENDDADDVHVQGTDAKAAVPTFADIRSLTIRAEDELSLFMDVELADFAQDSDTAAVSFNDQVDLDIEFALEGSEVTYKVHLELHGATQAGGPQVLQYAFVKGFCASVASGQCHFGNPQVSIDYDANLLSIKLTKADLHGESFGHFFGGPGVKTSDGEEEETFPDLVIGSKFNSFALKTSGTFGNVEVSDKFPETGTINHPFVLAFPQANRAVSVDFENAYREEFAVVPAQNQTVPFQVTNHEGPKRIVLLTYEFLGAPADVAGYRVVGPSNVSVPSHETREFRAYVFTPETLKPVRFIIRGRSLGVADLGMARAELINGLPLGPQTPEFHILRHVAPGSQTQLDTCFGCVGSGYLYTATSYGDEFKAEGEMPFPSSWGFFFNTPGRSANQVAFKPGVPVELEIKVTSSKPQSETVPMTAQVSYAGIPLLTGTQEHDVGADGAVFKFSKVPKIPNKVLPSQGVLEVQISGRDAPDPMTERVAGLHVDVGASLLKIPFGPIPDEYLEKPLASPFQVSILGDREDFVNPGEAHLFNVSVLNYDTREQRLHLDAKVTAGNGGVEVLPGRLFDLAPGHDITAGVLVRAPAEAQEGDKITIHFNASADNGAFTPATLSLVVTTSDRPDDTGKYVAKQEDIEKQVDKAPAKSPGLGLLMAIAGSLCVLQRRRSLNP